MPIEYIDHRAVFHDRVSVEEADNLLQWLQEHDHALIDLGPCVHLHTANLQVLLAARCSISAWPGEPTLLAWLKNTLLPSP